MQTLKGAIDALRRAERHPCSLCRLKSLCKRQSLACRTMDRFTNIGKIKNYGVDWPTRERYNMIFPDFVPYDVVVHGP